MWGSRPCLFMIISNTKRHPNNTKTDQLPISEVITGLPRPYHNINPKFLKMSMSTPLLRVRIWKFAHNTCLMCPCRAFNECFFLCVFVRYLVFFCDIWVLRDTTFSAKKQKTEKKLIRKRLGKGTLNMCAKCQGLTLENGVDIWTFLRLRAVLNAAIFFLILPPNVWSQEAARI